MFTRFRRIPRIHLHQPRHLTISPRARAAIGNYGFVFNIFAGAYIGGLVVCFGSLYFMYSDANSRQYIPFELPFSSQITAVKAINKDDVLLSPRHAVKHYRRLLIDIARESDPSLDVPDGTYQVPVLSADVLVQKSSKFANFYVDIVMRYAKALLAKGQLAPSIHMLSEIVDNDDIFFQLGDVDRLAECCRLLSRMEGPKYLARALDLITSTNPRIKVDPNYALAESSSLTDALIAVLNDTAFSMAKHGQLAESLTVYLSTLKALTKIENMQEHSDRNIQTQYPFLNCDSDNLRVLVNEIKSHVAEVLWALGHKKSSVLWNEEVVERMYFDHGSSRRVSLMMVNVLNNLITAYGQMGNLASVKRCVKMLENIDVVRLDMPDNDWYSNLIKRFSKIIYQNGPLGILEKPLRERFGKPQPIPEIEQMEDEDVE